MTFFSEPLLWPWPWTQQSTHSIRHWVTVVHDDVSQYQVRLLKFQRLSPFTFRNPTESNSAEHVHRSMLLYVHIDIVLTTRDGGPRTSTSTFTQLLKSAQHCFFFFFHDDLRPRKPQGLLGTGKRGMGNESPGPHLCSHRSWALCRTRSCWCGAQWWRADMLATTAERLIQFCFTSTETIRLIRDGLPNAEIVLLFLPEVPAWTNRVSEQIQEGCGKTQVSTAWAWASETEKGGGGVGGGGGGRQGPGLRVPVPDL